MTALTSVVAGLGRAIGVVATSTDGAQDACDRLVAAGVTSVLTFAPGALTAPAGVEVRRVDVATELQILAFHAGADAAPDIVTSPTPAPSSATAPARDLQEVSS